MEPKRVLSQAVEDYLKTIYKLQAPAFASTSDIARALEVSPASATNMAKRLDSMGLARYLPYRGVRLTEAGTQIALEVLRHHRLLETYLREVMGYSWEQMHREAEHLEHHISEEFEDRIEELLGFPTHDPHGHPIPARDGSIPERESQPLPTAAIGINLLVSSLVDSDPAALHRLESLGLMPGQTIRINEATENELVLETGSSHVRVDRALAERVFVTATTKIE
jgi:DtxR family Mn-dependent transcriptional regulator